MSWFDAAATYSSGKTPKYKVGDKVYKLLVILPELGKRKLQKFCVPCEVTEVSTKKSGWIFKEFTYKVRFLESGRKFKSIYESQLAKEQQRGQYSDPEVGDPFPSNDEEDK